MNAVRSEVVSVARRFGPALMVAVFAGVLAFVWLSALADGWRLVGDDAIIVLRSSDTLSGAPPLTGMPSAFSQWSGAADPFHPGPWPLWALSPVLAVFGADEGGALAGDLADRGRLAGR